MLLVIITALEKNIAVDTLLDKISVIIKVRKANPYIIADVCKDFILIFIIITPFFYYNNKLPKKQYLINFSFYVLYLYKENPLEKREYEGGI